MNSVDVAARLVKKRFSSLYKAIVSSVKNESFTDTVESQSETECIWMILQDLKQELMTIVQRMPIDSGIQSINTKEIDECLTGFEVALREEYDKAREQYKDIIESNIELQRVFIDITSVSIPDCRALKSEYMTKNYPDIVKYEEVVNKYKGLYLKNGVDTTESELIKDEEVQDDAECTDVNVELSRDSMENTNYIESESTQDKTKISAKIKQAKLKKEEEKRERDQRIKKAKRSFKNLLTNIQIVATSERLIELMESIQNAINEAKNAVDEQATASRDLFNNSDKGSIFEITDTVKQLKYELFTDADGQKRFRLRHCRSGEIVLVSKGFVSMSECIKGIEHLSGFVFENEI